MKSLLLTIIFLIFLNSLAINGEELAIDKSPILCRREHRDSFHAFVADRWNSARKSLKLPSMNVSAYANDVQYRNFVHFQSGVVIFTTPDNKTDIPCVRIYKCANEAIVQNLFFGKKFNYYPPNWITIKSFTEFIKYKNDYVVRPDRVLEKTFTFVRDPVDRFESAFAEAIWQSNEYIHRRHLGPAINVTSTEDIKSLMIQFLDLNTPFSPRAVAHLSTMSQVFFEYDIDIVGYLETFLSEWQSKIITAYRLNSYNHKFNHNLGKHNSAINHPGMNHTHQSRINSARFYYQKLLDVDNDAMIAVCHLIMIDYLCLPKYALPAKCQHLYPILNAGRKLLEIGTTNPN